jgi:dynein heavy chain, axonemal
MALEDCLSTGKPLLIENIEEDLDPVLDPVLAKRVIKKGRSYILPLADKEVDFDPNFKLFCTTRLPNPHFTPELSAKVTLIDFTVTMVGLEDQLLGRLIGKEKGELEEQRQALLEEVQNYKKKIKQLEDDLLDRLSNSQVCQIDSQEWLAESALLLFVALMMTSHLVQVNTSLHSGQALVALSPTLPELTLGTS